MELKLEDLAYQREAIDAVVRLFVRQRHNTFDMACREDVWSNVLTIPTEQSSDPSKPAALMKKRLLSTKHWSSASRWKQAPARITLCSRPVPTEFRMPDKVRDSGEDPKYTNSGQCHSIR